MPVEGFLQHVSDAFKTGEWWNLPWWREVSDASDQPEKEIAEKAFCELRQVFDGAWFREQVPLGSLAHPIAILLLIKGLVPFQCLLRLGRALCAVRNAGLLSGKLRNRLKLPAEFSGVHWEVEIMGYLLSRGFSLAPHAIGAGNRRADLHVSGSGEEIIIELHRRTAAFPRELAQKNMDWYEKAQPKRLDEIFESPEIIGANRAAQDKEADRIFRLLKGGHGKIGQLPDKPGIILTQPALPFSLDRLQNHLARFGESRKCFLGVILVWPHFSGGAIGFSVQWLPNKHAGRAMSEFAAVRAICELGEGLAH